MTNDLWQETTSITRLTAAWTKVRRNGGMAGGDGVSIEQYRRRVRAHLVSLSDKLLTGQFEHGPCLHFDIPKSSGGTRRLSVPPVEDRIVHTAIAQTLSPVLEPHFEESSFAYRPGRSVQQAVRAIERWRNDGYKHVIEADIVDYFGSINHHLLLASLARHLKDQTGPRPLIEFVTEALAHQGEELETPGKGLVQGSPLSPLLANLYLDGLDEQIRGRGIRIVRFADDFVILCKTLKRAEFAFEEMSDILADIGLSLHPQKTRLVDFEQGFEFLGYLFVRSLAMQKRPTQLSEQLATTLKRYRQPEPTPPRPEQREPEAPDEETPQSNRYATGERVLYVLDKGRSITAGNEALNIHADTGHLLSSIPVSRIDRLEVGRHVQIGRDVSDACLAGDTQLVFVDGHGETRGRLVGNEDRYPALQLAQGVANTTESFAVELVRKTIDARIRNQRTQLFRLNRRQQLMDVTKALETMGRHLHKLPKAVSIDQIRGLEGAAGAQFWPALGCLCETARLPFRRTRPAKDGLNAAINFMTAMLERDIRATLRSVGLHAGFGFLHSPHDYAEAGVYDLMEPFRAPLSEGLPVYLFNARRLRADMFHIQHNGVVRIDREARRAIVSGYESALARRVNKPDKKGKLAWRPMMRYQALSLARAYRKNDPDLFIPYLMEA